MSEQRTILIAEDLTMVRRPLALILKRRGYRVIEVSDGAAAREALEQGGIDAALLDLMMPVADGFEVLDAMQGRADAPPILVYTSHPLTGHVERALALGAREVIVKGRHTIAEIAERLEAAMATGGDDAA
ncbi:MAG: response regulator [Planctomycetota bacterium]|nr:MAG: response regulator [Planctomycetota bacterium]